MKSSKKRSIANHFLTSKLRRMFHFALDDFINIILSSFILNLLHSISSLCRLCFALLALRSSSYCIGQNGISKVESIYLMKLIVRDERLLVRAAALSFISQHTELKSTRAFYAK